MVSVFRAPYSFTGEDIVEIACHGAPYIQQQLLQLLVRKGARLAKAGEFTQRAFLNGKMDLSQARITSYNVCYTKLLRNLIRYSEADCNIMAEGAFDIGIDLDQVKTRNSGTLIDVRSKNQIMVTSMMSIDFFFNKDITSVLYTMILNSKAKASTLTSTTFTKRLAEWDGTKTALLMDEQRTTIGMTEDIPDELQSRNNFV